MRYFPLFFDILDKSVLVIGGGEVATRKVEALVRAGAKVTVVAPVLTAFLAQLAKNNTINWLESNYERSCLNCDWVQVWATTDDSELNHQVYYDAKEFRLFVNVVDDQPFCDFITPAIVNRGKVQIAISSGGASPVLIRNIRQKLETYLPRNTEILAEFGEKSRDRVKKDFPSVDLRRQFWERFFSMPQVEWATSFDELEQAYEILLKDESDVHGQVSYVFFSDDPELVSLKALQIMQKAELVIFFEPLHPIMNKEYVNDLCRRDAERAEVQEPDKLEAVIKHNNGRNVVVISDNDMQSRLSAIFVDATVILPSQQI